MSVQSNYAGPVLCQYNIARHSGGLENAVEFSVGYVVGVGSAFPLSYSPLFSSLYHFPGGVYRYGLGANMHLSSEPRFSCRPPNYIIVVVRLEQTLGKR